MRTFLLSFLFIVFFSCNSEREATNTLYINVQGADSILVDKVQKIIFDDLSRFDCVKPKDWNIKFDDTPCSIVKEYDEQELSSDPEKTKRDYLLNINIRSAVEYEMRFICSNGNKLFECKKLRTFSVKKNTANPSANLAADILKSPSILGAN